MTTDPGTPVVLAERSSSDHRVRWQGRISSDRGRLELVVVVDFGHEQIAIPVLSDIELRALLATASTPTNAPGWICQECGRVNTDDRKWCVSCTSQVTT